MQQVIFFWREKITGYSGVAIAPAIPGFIDTLLELNYFPDWLLEIYDYAWFTSLFIAFPMYYIANRIFREKSEYEILEETFK